MLQAALFELEDVLVETGGARRAALAEALAAEGVTLAPDALAACAAGRAPEDAVAAAVRALAPAVPALAALDATAQELVARRAERAFERSLAAGVTLAPGVGAALDALAGALRLGVVTRARRRDAHALLAAAGLEAHFACVVTTDDVRVPKPAPEGYRAALARLAARSAPRAIDAAQIVAFEDAAPGVAAARAAGLRVVRVASSAQRADACGAEGPPPTPDAWLAALAGLTPGSLAALLDLVPAPS
jgi:HAD superfamily hydrolase (TIGR01509 family)